MNQLKKAGIILVLGIIIILVRNYELQQSHEIAENSREHAELVRVVDGDTIVVRVAGNEEKIRIIGINTPESVKTNSPVECFGKEAGEHISDLLEQSGTLRIETDPTQDTRDSYGRLLAHVFIDDVNIGNQMVFDGYAYEFTYREPYIYQSDYRNAQTDARNNNRGLWSPETCNGQK